MKKILEGILILFLIVGCTNNAIRTNEDLVKIESQKNIVNDDIQKLVAVVKNRNFNVDMRKRAFKLLVKNDYSEMRALLEEMIPTENDLKTEFIKESLKYKNFKYTEDDKKIVLEILALPENRKDKKNMMLFFSIYSGENISVDIETVNLIDEAVFIKTDEEAEKMNKLIILSDNFDLFKKYLYNSGFKFLEYFAKNKPEWVEKVIKEDKNLFMKIKNYLNVSNYELFKKIVYFYLEDKNSGMETVAAEIIVDMEGNTEEKLLSDNYYIQISAIRKYGLDESRTYLEKNIDSKNKNLFRALSFLKSPKVFTVLKNKFEEEKDISVLEYIYMLDDIKAQEYFNKEFLKLDIKEKNNLLSKIILYDQNDVINLTYKLISDEKDANARLVYLDFLIIHSPDFFIKKASELLESPKYSAEEKKYIKDKLAEVAGEETKDQILKSVENKVYLAKLNEEKTIIPFSGKLKLWYEYNKIFPDSFFKEEIDKKIKMYDNYLERIKEELENSKSAQLKQINDTIAEYKEQMQKETNMDRIKFYREKISALEKEKNNIGNKNTKSDKEKLNDFETEYLDLLDRINSITSQIYSLENSSEGKNNPMLTQMKDILSKLMTKRSELLEKIIIFYGYYIDKYGREKINDIILRDINGVQK